MAPSSYSALKTKFESADPNEVVEFDEYLHGPDHAELEKMSTGSSAGTVEEEDEDVKDLK